MPNNPVLTREEFKKQTFSRDKNKCIFCEKEAVDAHHIIDRKLWENGGYYLNNSSSVCEEHHIMCETTEISVEEVRKACGITEIVIPSYLNPNLIYDKWGNPILKNGKRAKGEMFFLDTTQKILKKGGMLNHFSDYYLEPFYPLSPWSKKDDTTPVIKDFSALFGEKIVIFEYNPEAKFYTLTNKEIYSDTFSDINIDLEVSEFWLDIAMEIPYDFRINVNFDGKNIIGKNIWNKEECLNYEDTAEYFEILSIRIPNILFEGIFEEDKIESLKHKNFITRPHNKYNYLNFKENTFKNIK